MYPAPAAPPHLGLLQTEDIRIRFLKILYEVFPHTGPQPVDIPGNKFHKYLTIKYNECLVYHRFRHFANRDYFFAPLKTIPANGFLSIGRYRHYIVLIPLI